MVALRFLVPSVGVQIPVSLPLLRALRFLGVPFFCFTAEPCGLMTEIQSEC